MKNFILILSLLCLTAFAYGVEEPTTPYIEYSTPPIDYEAAELDFYSTKNPYGEFSNFASFPILVDGLIWPTSEHYYQAQKYTDPELIERVRLARTPMDAANIGRDPSLPKRDDWDDYRNIVMDVAVRAKFSQHEILRTLLKSTKVAVLFEHTKNDCYWADCGDRTGKNKLGELLMKVRSELP